MFLPASPLTLVGASLLAKAAGQPTSLLTDLPLSRASPLPQGVVVFGGLQAKKRPEPVGASEVQRCG